MRDIRSELQQLREKLRRMEEREASRDARDASSTPVELPPWESVSADSAFEASLTTVSSSAEWYVSDERLLPERVPPSRQVSGPIEACVTGKVVETASGKHFQSETLYECGLVHGNFEVSGLAGLPGSTITALCPAHQGGGSETWAFVDTETIGLAGGAGSFAFLIGLGRMTEQGFLVTQYFLREPSEEASVLESLAQDLSPFATMVTYNGRSFDAPLLETRYRMTRQRIPFAEMPHLDLLFACRRLWKQRFESCKLTNLERDVLDFERVGDVPGFLIPSLYTNYLRTRDAGSLVPVFQHNALDILSLACLTSLVGATFENPALVLERHPTECVGLGRWLLQMGRRDEALPFLWKAANSAIAEDLLARTLWEIAIAERQMGRYAEMQKPLRQLLDFPNRLQAQALEALSILYERRLVDLDEALRFAERLMQMQPSPQNASRMERLTLRRARNRTRRLLE